MWVLMLQKGKTVKDKTHAYDRALKRVFSHPIMMGSLIKAFVQEDWASSLDFSTLEMVNVKHTTEELHNRESDLIWKIHYKGEALYIIFLMEFQSRIDPFMSVRILTYMGLIFQEIIRVKKGLIHKKLPPVFSLVFYTGEYPWSAPLSLSNCLSDAIPAGLRKYQPNVDYMLLDVGRVKLNKGECKEAEDNLAVQLVELENASQLTDSKFILLKLMKLLKDKKFDSLRRDIVVYLRRALKLHQRFPEMTLEELEEGGGMLSERMDRWEKELLQEGRQEGRQAGLQEGIRKERMALLLKLLNSQPESVSPEFKKNLPNLTNQALEDWINKLLNQRVHTEM